MKNRYCCIIHTWIVAILCFVYLETDDGKVETPENRKKFLCSQYEIKDGHMFYLPYNMS